MTRNLETRLQRVEGAVWERLFSRVFARPPGEIRAFFAHLWERLRVAGLVGELPTDGAEMIAAIDRLVMEPRDAAEWAATERAFIAARREFTREKVEHGTQP